MLMAGREICLFLSDGYLRVWIREETMFMGEVKSERFAGFVVAGVRMLNGENCMM